MSDFFKNLQARRTVLKRTKVKPELPAVVLYIETLGGEMKRRVLDTKGGEHLINDKVMQSYYRVLPGSQAKELIAQHWASVSE